VALVLSACGSAPTGAVGTSLEAMGGTITLDKVVSPSNPATYYAEEIAAGHELVAVELTVRNTAASAKYFNNIYTLSKLVDSQKQAFLARNTKKFPVTDCLGLPLFGVLQPGASVTGCLVFRLPAAAVPAELKISGKHPADFTIGAQAISASRPRVTYPAAAAAAHSPLTTLPRTTGGIGAEALGPDTTGATGSGATGATTTTKPPAGSVAASTTTTEGGAYLPGDHLGLHHHRQSNMAPKIKGFSPRDGAVGSAVTIIGHRLWNVTQVSFNGVVATVTTNTGGRVAVTVPAGASSGHITVTTSGGVAPSTTPFTVD